MKRKNKNIVQMISLLMVLGVLIVGYVWYSNWKAKEGQPEETSEENVDDEPAQDIMLGSIDTTQISKLHYQAEEADLIFVLKDEVWILETEPERPINQSNVKDLINLIDEVKAERLINEDPEDLAEYGLSESKALLEATLADGTTLSYRIGDEAIDNEGYYALVNDDGKIYLLAGSYGSGLSYSNLEMTAVEEAPAITAANIQHIDVINRDSQDFEIVYDAENEYDNSNTGMFPWVMKKPYEDGYNLDTSKLTDLLTNYSTFDFISCIDYNSEDLATYGLADPAATIYVGYYESRTETLTEPEKDPATGEEITEKTYQEDKEFKLYVGNQEEEGNYYVRMEGSNAVYTISASSIDTMLWPDTFDLLNAFIHIPNIEAVDSITAEIDGVPYTMEIKRTTSKNDAGEEETTKTYYNNGNEVTEDNFKGVYQSMVSAKYDSELKEEVTTEGLTPILTISYHIFKDKDVTLTASYLPYNESFYLVDTGKKIRFLADKRQIDDIAKAIKEFKAPEEN
ncbi:MAG: hypothetical protein K0S76_1360 [Herbinix sp.]|jgi:hypothetical protein|nr:hypothetical protein [Herbinix sp.]